MLGKGVPPVVFTAVFTAVFWGVNRLEPFSETQIWTAAGVLVTAAAIVWGIADDVL